MKALATALALLLVSVVATGKSWAQISALRLVEIDAENAQPNGKWGQGITLIAEFPGQSYWSSFRSRTVSSHCVGYSWEGTFDSGTRTFTSSCGDSTHSGEYIFDYRDLPDYVQWVLYANQMPLEVAVGEHSGVASGADVIVLNSVSIRGSVTDADMLPLSHRVALQQVLRKAVEVADTSSVRSVLWVRSGHRDVYYEHALDELTNELPIDSEACREWDPVSTAHIEDLYRQGVVMVTDAGLATDDKVGYQRYPACLEEVIAVTPFGMDSSYSGFSGLNHGATLTAPMSVEYSGQIISIASFATARVVGAILRSLELYPHLTSSEIQRILEESGVKVGFHKGFEASLIQVEAAVALAAQLVSVEDVPEKEEWVVLEAYPNPYRAGDMLNLEVAGEGSDRSHGITLFDILGREVRELHEGEVVLDLPSGVYLLRSETSDGRPLTRLLTVVH